MCLLAYYLIGSRPSPRGREAQRETGPAPPPRRPPSPPSPPPPPVPPSCFPPQSGSLGRLRGRGSPPSSLPSVAPPHRPQHGLITPGGCRIPPQPRAAPVSQVAGRQVPGGHRDRVRPTGGARAVHVHLLPDRPDGALQGPAAELDHHPGDRGRQEALRLGPRGTVHSFSKTGPGNGLRVSGQTARTGRAGVRVWGLRARRGGGGGCTAEKRAHGRKTCRRAGRRQPAEPRVCAPSPGQGRGRSAATRPTGGARSPRLQPGPAAGPRLLFLRSLSQPCTSEAFSPHS